MSSSLLSLYARSSGRYDELLDRSRGGGVPRRHWAPLIEALDASTPGEMRARQAFVAERIRENGITYNVYADPRGTDRPWALDPLPLILPADEWGRIERAVIQRAGLLDRVLADLYGGQTLIRSGAVPPALVFGHNGFLWPCHGIVPPSGHFLHLYAVDLARSPDGQWWVIADRTQGPSGAGYALENRLVVSKLFPELFRDQRIHHLADFFRRLQDSLYRQAPVDPGEAPFVVLLTPGPYNETYFEQSYLSRYLGFPLVEGQDLTVRGDTVYLKTLGGLKRVHVILRRLDDDYADPLELRGESSLGVPGLVEATRSGRVLISNALGSGVLESAGLLAFLPGIARRLLGEDLAMPAVATWWCGEAPALEYVIEHLDELVIKPAYPSQRMEPVFGRNLTAAERANWIERLRARPHAYVGQELVKLSQAPVLPETSASGLDRRLMARAIGLRVYAVSTPDGWHVMPGGLTRVAGGGKVDILSMQRGGTSKDTWVMSDGPVSQFSLLKGELGSRDIVRTARSLGHLTSRTVENLFWLGRYAERIENSARLLRIAAEALLEEGDGALGPEVGPPVPSGVSLARAPGRLAASVATCELFGLLPPAAEQPIAARLVAGVDDESWWGSLASTLRRTHWAATQARERLSLDHWHALTRLGELLRRPPGEGLTQLAHLPATLDRVLLACISLAGFAMDDMTRDAGWRFLILGRRIERLQNRTLAIGRFLDHCDGRPQGVDGLLDLADSTETYRQRYLRTPDIVPTLDLVVFDTENPHSVAFQADMLLRYLQPSQRELGRAEFWGRTEDSPDALDATTLREAFAGLREFSLADLERGRPESAGGENGRVCTHCGGCTELSARLRVLHDAAGELSNRIAARIFAHAEPASRTVSS